MCCVNMVDRPTWLRNTWFGLLCMILCAASWKFDLAMVVAVLGTTSSFKFLWDLELPGGIVLWRARFVFFVSFRWRRACVLCLNLFWECVVNKILWIAALHKVLFKFCNGFFTNSRGPTQVYFWVFPDTSELSLCTNNSSLSRTLPSSFFFPTPSPVWRLFAFISFLKVPHDFLFLSAMLFCYG